MHKCWSIFTGKCSEIGNNGINMLITTLSNYGSNIEFINDNSSIMNCKTNIIYVGIGGELVDKCLNDSVFSIPSDKEGYVIYVGNSIIDKTNQMICITANNDNGLLYGCMDFINKYLSDIIYEGKDIYREGFYKNPFDYDIPSWIYESSPAIHTRAIWTWGHVIYDYKGFFQNMAKLKLNEIVIWNDYAPINANEIVEYAHSYGIKVIWGFAWGWSTSCRNDFSNLNDVSLKTLKNDIIEKYEKEYKNILGDGIYFQSLTEFSSEILNGKCVAEVVTNLVNDVSQELFKTNPNLHLQFGLHATSVKNKLEIIKNVDKRIYIIWEDCGAFPYNYDPYNINDFDETELFTKKISNLRDEEKFGIVIKGMLKLDWSNFKHQNTSIRIGEYEKEFILQRQKEKNHIWKSIQGGWLKNAKYAQKIIQDISLNSKEPIIEALIEDSMFENKIMFPSAIYSELLWNPECNIDELISQVSKYKCVNFANL